MEPQSTPAAAPDSSGAAASRFWRRRGTRRIMSLGGMMLVLAACAAVYARAAHYGRQVVESRLVNARIEIVNPPAYLDRAIVNSLLQEAYQFAQKDEVTCDRVRNTLDEGVLGELADLYTGTQVVNGRRVDQQAIGFNAWIERVVQVRRAVAGDKSLQTIQIEAQWRRPAAWLLQGQGLYLVDPNGRRLPGDYRPQDRSQSTLMVIYGVRTPFEGTGSARGYHVPAPGEVWNPQPDGTMGEDLAAGLKLLEVLRRQPFASQIDTIDVSNMGGGRDPLAPWIVLLTRPDSQGARGQVYWGRPMGEERFYEVRADQKVKTLNELNRKFSRIDGGNPYVDIRTEVVWRPRTAP